MPRTKGAFILRFDLHRPDPKLQPVLGDLPMQDPEPSYTEKFTAFHQQHPDIYDLLHFYALEQATSGAKRISTKALYEQVRAETYLKLDNCYTPFYARLLAADPRLTSYIELRTRKAE